MIAVLGSVNWDVGVRVPHLPAPGETVGGEDAVQGLGGKGANQAVAAARAGGAVRLIACLGRDAFGDAAQEGLLREGLDLTHLRRVEAPSGLALIGLDHAGQNSILLSPGANAHLSPAQLTESALEGVRVLLCQLETPLETARLALERAHARGVLTLLNASPLPPSGVEVLLAHTDVLLLNEVEAGGLLGRPLEGVPNALEGVRRLGEWVGAVVLTLGALGAVWCAGAEVGHCPALPVRPLDTTGAGDAFAGALATALLEGLPLGQAVRFAGAAGGLATLRRGAALSAPHRHELEAACSEVPL